MKLKIHKMKKEGVIYTCITGNYDALINHGYINPNWDYVCFTDDLKIKQPEQSVWDITLLKFDQLDNVRNQRWHKLHPHELFPEYKASIWVDGNINIKKESFFKDLEQSIKANDSILFSPHPLRDCLYKEGEACISLGKDDTEMIREQISLMKEKGFPENQGMFETGIIFRTHNNIKTNQLMADWWWWIENYSRRDQLSLTFVLWKNSFTIQSLLDTPFKNKSSVEVVSSYNHMTKEEMIVLLNKKDRDIYKMRNTKTYIIRRAFYKILRTLFGNKIKS